MLQKKDIVVFDFDGTLSASDSNYEFFKYCFRHSIKPWLYLPKVLVIALASFLNPRGVWWRENIRSFISPKMVEKFTPHVVELHKKNRFAWAKAQVDKEKKAGNIVLLISASPDYLIPELVSDMKFDAVLCSRVHKDKPWKYKFMCWGNNKVIALDSWARQNKYIPKVVRAYSDSVRDMPIMSLAREKVWIDSKTGERK